MIFEQKPIVSDSKNLVCFNILAILGIFILLFTKLNSIVQLKFVYVIEQKK